MEIQKDALAQDLVHAAVVPPGCEIFPQAPFGGRQVRKSPESISNALAVQYGSQAGSQMQQTSVLPSGEQAGGVSPIGGHAPHVVTAPYVDASLGTNVLLGLQRDMAALTAMVQDMQEKMAAMSLASATMHSNAACSADNTQTQDDLCGTA